MQSTVAKATLMEKLEQKNVEFSTTKHGVGSINQTDSQSNNQHQNERGKSLSCRSNNAYAVDVKNQVHQPFHESKLQDGLYTDQYIHSRHEEGREEWYETPEIHTQDNNGINNIVTNKINGRNIQSKKPIRNNKATRKKNTHIQERDEVQKGLAGRRLQQLTRDNSTRARN